MNNCLHAVAVAVFNPGQLSPDSVAQMMSHASLGPPLLTASEDSQNRDLGTKKKLTPAKTFSCFEDNSDYSIRSYCRPDFSIAPRIAAAEKDDGTLAVQQEPLSSGVFPPGQPISALHSAKTKPRGDARPSAAGHISGGTGKETSGGHGKIPRTKPRNFINVAASDGGQIKDESVRSRSDSALNCFSSAQTAARDRELPRKHTPRIAQGMENIMTLTYMRMEYTLCANLLVC